MKKYIIVFFILVSNMFFSQENISISNVFINSNVVLFNSINQVWTSQESLKVSLGNPLSVSTFYSEIDDSNITRLSYNNSIYDFMNNQLVSFELSNGARIKINDKIIIVGQTLESEISSLFPNSKKQGVIFNVSSEYYEIGATSLQNGVNINLDYLLYIEINTINSSKKVSKIRFWYP